MAYPQATFEYTGGIGGQYTPVLGGWRATVTHGMTPSPINVSIPMVPGQQPPQKNGDLILRYGDAKPIKLKNCTIDKITQDVGGRLIWNIVILDRRFRWRWADVSGWWNARWRIGTAVPTETQMSHRPSTTRRCCAPWRFVSRSRRPSTSPAAVRRSSQWSVTRPPPTQ